MERREYKCEVCGHRGVKELMDQAEAREHRFQLIRPRCDRCKSTRIRYR